jgi:ketosteroid isomerase-like protein
VFGGDTAILTARMRMHGTNQSGAFDDQLLLIHVWVKLNGSWQLAPHQTTKLQ